MKEKESASNRPEEIFGYPIANGSDRASGTRRKQWCPFENVRCRRGALKAARRLAKGESLRPAILNWMGVCFGALMYLIPPKTRV